MILATKITPEGLKIAIAEDMPKEESLKEIETKSEGYLEIIEDTVKKAGGFQNIEKWAISQEGESFTSIRGLITTANALSKLHKIEMYSLETGKKLGAPLMPNYTQEPNITQN